MDQYKWSANYGEVDLDADVITWIQVILGNTLMYPVSVNNYPRPERGVFCILIVDLISKSALKFFSLLFAINYNYNIPSKSQR